MDADCTEQASPLRAAHGAMAGVPGRMPLWLLRLLALLALVSACAVIWKWPLLLSQSANSGPWSGFPLHAIALNLLFQDGVPRWTALAYAWLLAASAVSAALLANWLLWRGGGRAPSRLLALAMALQALALAWFVALRPWLLPQLTTSVIPLLADAIALACFGWGLLALMQCFRSYPEPVTLERESHRIETETREQRALATRIRQGVGLWRLWSWLPRERFGPACTDADRQLPLPQRLFRSREAVWLLLFVLLLVIALQFVLPLLDGPPAFRLGLLLGIVYLAVLHLDPVASIRFRYWGLRASSSRLARGEFRLVRSLQSWPGWIGMAVLFGGLVAYWHASIRSGASSGGPMSLAVLLVGLVAMLYSLHLLWFSFRYGGEAHRRAIALIYIGNAGAMLVWTLAVAGLLAYLGLERLGAHPASDWVLSHLNALRVLALPWLALAFVLSLFLSVLLRGSFDPELALRRGAATAVLGIMLTALFVALEGAVSSQVVVRVGLPSEAGALVAGTMTALAFGPLRTRVERRVGHLMARLLPPEALAQGERAIRSVLFTDLSGFTRLSEQDEAEALTLAALLHRSARRVADRHAGRLVKTLGDATLLLFDQAQQAVIAARELHAEFRREARRRGLEPLPLHSSVHCGEVVLAHDGDVFGAVVNLAARLQSVAGPNELVATSTMEEAVAALGLKAEDLGARRFKNVAEPVRCLRLRLAD